MTVNQTQDTRSVVPAQSHGPDPVARPDSWVSIDGRHHSAKDEEEYLRSVMEQAKTDIAAAGSWLQSRRQRISVSAVAGS